MFSFLHFLPFSSPTFAIGSFYRLLLFSNSKWLFVLIESFSLELKRESMEMDSFEKVYCDLGEAVVYFVFSR
jgi:hypothetical protein